MLKRVPLGQRRAVIQRRLLTANNTSELLKNPISGPFSFAAPSVAHKFLTTAINGTSINTAAATLALTIQPGSGAPRYKPPHPPNAASVQKPKTASGRLKSGVPES